MAVLLGGASFILLYQKASEIERRSAPVKVLVASRYIPPQVPIQGAWVDQKPIPEAYVAPGALSQAGQLEGLVALAPFSAGEQIQSNKLGKMGESLGVGLEPGRRAYTLPLEEASGVGGLLNPGDKVDLLVKANLSGREAAAFLYQDLRVLAVGGRMTPGDKSVEGMGTGYSHVTLSVSPEEAETLFFLEGRALFRLVLRAAGDGGTVNLPAAEEADLYRRLKGSR